MILMWQILLGSIAWIIMGALTLGIVARIMGSEVQQDAGFVILGWPLILLLGGVLGIMWVVNTVSTAIGTQIVRLVVPAPPPELSPEVRVALRELEAELAAVRALPRDGTGI